MSSSSSFHYREKPCIKCNSHNFTAHNHCYDCKQARKRRRTGREHEPPSLVAAEYRHSDDDDESWRDDVAPLYDPLAYEGDWDPENFSEEHKNRSDDDSDLSSGELDEETGKRKKRPPRSRYRPKACLYCKRNRQPGKVVKTGRDFQVRGVRKPNGRAHTHFCCTPRSDLLWCLSQAQGPPRLQSARQGLRSRRVGRHLAHAWAHARRPARLPEDGATEAAAVQEAGVRKKVN